MTLSIQRRAPQYGLLALNGLYWTAVLLTAHGFNTGNEDFYHYPIRNSPLYWPAMAGMAAVQALMLYVETGYLLGRLWERGRKWACLIGIVGLWIVAANLGVLVIKLVQPQVKVQYFTHVGFVVGPHPPQWTWAAWKEDLTTYLVGYSLWIIVYALAWFTRKSFTQQRLLRQIRLQQTETELQFLKQQLNPHFLFNTLNNLYGLSLQQDRQMPQMLLQLSELLRYMLYESSAAQVSFEKEKEALLSYIQLERLRLPPEVRIHCEATADENIGIPPLLWLPVAENLFKHGRFGTHSEASLTFRIIADQLEIQSVNACEISGTETSASGIGLHNLRERLRLLFPNRHQLTYSQQAGRFEIAIQIQLRP